MKDFDYKVAVITGAASGMGRALAIELSRLGCHLAIADLNLEGLKETAALAYREGRQIMLRKLDVSQREMVYTFAENVQKEYGQVDLVINNAGVSTNIEIEDLDYEYFESLMNINFWGVVYGCKAFLPFLRQRPEAHIVNVASIFAIAAFPRYAPYNAAKAAVRAFTETLAAEMMIQKIPIGVSCVFPGGVGTNIASTTEHHMRSTSGTSAIAGMEDKISALEREGKAIKEFYECADIVSAEAAAAIIIDGIRHKRLRILIGKDAEAMDALVRSDPDHYLVSLSGAWF